MFNDLDRRDQDHFSNAPQLSLIQVELFEEVHEPSADFSPCSNPQSDGLEFSISVLWESSGDVLVAAFVDVSFFFLDFSVHVIVLWVSYGWVD